MKILLQEVNLSHQTIRQQIESYLELFRDYFTYRANYTSDIDDEDSLTGKREDVYSDWTFHGKRTEIASVEVHFIENDKVEVWMLEISVCGSATLVKIYFEREKEAKRILEILRMYMLGVDVNSIEGKLTLSKS